MNSAPVTPASLPTAETADEACSTDVRPNASRWHLRKLVMSVILATAAILAVTTAVLAAWTIQTKNPNNALGAGSVAAPTALRYTRRTTTLRWTLPVTTQRGNEQIILESTTGATGTYAVYVTIANGTTATYTLRGRFTTRDCFEVETVYDNWNATSTDVCA